MELKLLNAQGQAAAEVAAPDTIFGRDYNEALIHQVVVAFQANGRARAGMSSSPLWRGGGRAFPNSPDENFSQKVNKKMYRAGICSILSQLAREGRLSVVENFAVEAPKTKLLSEKLKTMGCLDSVLIIADEFNENLMLASRNLPNVLVVEPRYADPVSLVFFKKVLITKLALAKIEEMLA